MKVAKNFRFEARELLAKLLWFPKIWGSANQKSGCVKICTITDRSIFTVCNDSPCGLLTRYPFISQSWSWKMHCVWHYDVLCHLNLRREGVFLSSTFRTRIWGCVFWSNWYVILVALIEASTWLIKPSNGGHGAMRGGNDNIEKFTSIIQRQVILSPHRYYTQIQTHSDTDTDRDTHRHTHPHTHRHKHTNMHSFFIRTSKFRPRLEVSNILRIWASMFLILFLNCSLENKWWSSMFLNFTLCY